MSLKQPKNGGSYRESYSTKAFLFKEKHSRTERSVWPVTYYVIKFKDTAKRRACHINRSTEEEVIMKDLMYHKSHGVSFISKVPSDLSKIEKIVHTHPTKFTVTITREPYIPVFSSQTSTGYKGNK